MLKQLYICVQIGALVVLGGACGRHRTEVPGSKLEENVQITPDPVIVFPKGIQEVCKEINRHASNDYDYTKKYGRLLRQLSEEADFPYGLAQAYYTEGYLAVVYRNSYVTGLENYFEALKIYSDLEYNQGMAECYTAIGGVHFTNALYKEASFYYYKALDCWRILGNKPWEANTLRHIGLTYLETKAYDQAIDAYLEALALREDLDDARGQAELCNSLGGAYYHQFKPDQAVAYYQRALAFGEAVDSSTIIYVYNNLGEVYKQQGDYPTAMTWYQKAIAMGEQTTNQLGLMAAYCSIGELYLLEHKPRVAIDYLTKSKGIAEQVHNKQVLVEIHRLLSQAYVVIGDHASSVASEVKQGALQLELYQEELYRREDQSDIIDRFYHPPTIWKNNN